MDQLDILAADVIAQCRGIASERPAVRQMIELAMRQRVGELQELVEELEAELARANMRRAIRGR